MTNNASRPTLQRKVKDQELVLQVSALRKIVGQSPEGDHPVKKDHDLRIRKALEKDVHTHLGRQVDHVKDQVVAHVEEVHRMLDAALD